MQIITKTLLIGLIIFLCFGFSSNITVGSDNTSQSNIQNLVTLDAPTIEINLQSAPKLFIWLATTAAPPIYFFE